ncbi:hypothetical protein B0O80DRAFT_91664 [Mortierella sp. GBAus27b]|nr:hypothetical protein B0O80DRAFT_91664 [Mortierella sp. GBAus27b]
MTLPVDSLQVSSAAAAPFLKVFSIPELAGHINQYLRFADELRLRLASKALSELYRPDLQFKIVISDDDAPVDHWTSLHRKLGPRIRSLHLAVGPLTLPQNATLEAVYQHCGESLERLSIEYQGKDAKKLEDILAHFPRIQELSINIVPDMKVSDAMNALINLRKAFHRVARDGGEMVLLSALAIRFQEPQTVDWALLKEVLAFHPELKTLALDRLYIFERHYRGVTDDTTKEDNVDIVSTLEQLDRMSLGYGEEASGRPFTHPSLKTLVLKHCDISESRFGNMHKLFPDLHSLEMEACGGQWTLTLTKPPKAYQELLFPQLRTLKVFMVYQSSREDLVGFFRGRPHLINLETDIRSIKRDGLLELAQYCSSSLEEVSTTEDEAEATTVEDLAVVPRHKLKELSLQTYWSEDYSVEELEEFYGQPCFHELEYVYIQST